MRLGYPREFFPLFMVICGPKSAGKTFFVKAMHRFMFNKRMPIFASDDWVRTTVYGLFENVSGIPIIFDDLEKKRFNENAASIVKTDTYIDGLDIVSPPTFIITTNNLETSIDPALQKRVVYLLTDLTLDNVTATNNAKAVSDTLKQINGALYKEYLRRIIPKVNEMLRIIDENKSGNEWHPDLFKLSSETIVDIIKDYTKQPDYISLLSFEDYFGDNTVMRKEIREKILTDYEHNKSAFEIRRRRNELLYTPGEFSYEAKRVKDALPEYLEAKISGNKILMKLDKVEDFLGTTLKKGIFW